MLNDRQKQRLRLAASSKLMHGEFYLNVCTGGFTYEPELNVFLDLPPDAQLTFKDLWQLINRYDRQQLLMKAAHARRRDFEVNHKTYVTTGLGRGVWLQVVMCFIRDGADLFFAGHVRDVTRDQILVGELTKTANFFESIVDNIPHMIFVKEARDLRFVRINRAGERLFGLKNERILGKNDFDFFPREQAEFFVAKDQKVLGSGCLEAIEEEPIDTTDGRRYLRTKKIPILAPNGEPQFLLGISEDVTEKKFREEIIREQRQALLHASKMSALGEMAGGIAHEINNPMAIIRGYADFILHMIETNSYSQENLAEHCEKIVQTTERVAKIIAGLKAFARDGVEDPMLPVNIRSLIENTLEFCRERFRSHNVVVNLKNIPDAQIICQETQISQVLLNLLNNAFDAVVQRPDAWVSIEAKSYENVMQIFVRDSGKGIPDDIVDKVMQPFFTTKGVGKGTGLGLSISRNIVESHKGKLYFDQTSKTTCVVIELPFNPEKAKMVS